MPSLLKVTPDQVVPFHFAGLTVRAIPSEDRKPSKTILVAKDVASALGMGFTKDLTRCLSPEESNRHTVPVEGITEKIGGRPMTGITIQGLNRVMNRIRPEEGSERFERVEAFQVWVNDEVLPAILDTGRYEVPTAPSAPEQHVLPITTNDVHAARTVSGLIRTLSRGGLTEGERALANQAIRRLTEPRVIPVLPAELIKGPPPRPGYKRPTAHARRWFDSSDVVRALGREGESLRGLAQYLAKTVRENGGIVNQGANHLALFPIDAWPACLHAGKAYLDQRALDRQLTLADVNDDSSGGLH